MDTPHSSTITSYTFFQQLTELPYIDRILLYGSRARGTHRPRSDIDIAIDCPQATSHDWQTITDIIDEADTLLKIDCVRYDTMTQTSPLKESIDREGVVLFERKK